MAVRIVFMGAGKLAGPVFEHLVASGHTVVGLVTQPDRTGKGHHQHVNPLKVLAQAHGIPVLQPEKLRAPAAVAELRALQAQLHVVAAYGQILSAEVLAMPPLGTINVHASLLPKYRGATPIHAAVLNGDAEAGITIIELVQALDAGPMLGTVRTPIGPHETTGELEERLALLAPSITLQVIDQLAAGTAIRVEQDHSRATHVGKFTKEAGIVDWTQPADVLARRVRGMQPWPGSTTWWHSAGKPPQRWLLIQATAQPNTPANSNAPGTIIASNGHTLLVQTGQGILQLERLQPEGKRAMSVEEYLRGRPVAVGDHLGPQH